MTRFVLVDMFATDKPWPYCIEDTVTLERDFYCDIKAIAEQEVAERNAKRAPLVAVKAAKEATEGAPWIGDSLWMPQLEAAYPVIRAAAIEEVVAWLREQHHVWPGHDCDSTSWSIMADAIEHEFAEVETPCEHDWIDARNEVVAAGEYCGFCGLLREGNQ